MTRPRRPGWRALIAAVGASLSVGCADLLYRAALPFVYVEAELPAERIVRDLPYREGPGADAHKHRLDLFLPEGAGWPVLVFTHGGNWTSGDRTLRVGGKDVYGNVGRYFAARGVAVAVISYRLQPSVGWRDQVDDVAHAVAWVHREIARYDGDPDAIVLAGHSAGGQLVSRLALDPAPLARLDIDPHVVRGFVAVSALGLDLADEETYALGADRRYYAERFRNGEPTDAWKLEASAVRFARPDAPPALILYADGDSPALRRQSMLLHRALTAAGASSRLVEVVGQSHARMVLALSRDDQTIGPTVTAFVRETSDAPGPGAPPE